jgi:hypothetical protein
MEAGKQQITVDRADGASRGHINKFDTTRAVEPTHQGDLPDAQGAGSVVPDCNSGHRLQIWNLNRQLARWSRWPST